jgi:hypothetical protein
MNTLVVYSSKYGSTKEYAEWIAEDIGADIKRLSDVTDADLDSHDVIVFGSYLHIGKIVDVDFLQKKWSLLSQKRVVLFTVSGAGPGSEEQKFYENNLPTRIRSTITHFAFPGRAKNLDVKDTLLMLFPRGAALLTYLRERTPKNWAAYEHFRSFDGVKREHIAPLVAAVRSD